MAEIIQKRNECDNLEPQNSFYCADKTKDKYQRGNFAPLYLTIMESIAKDIHGIFNSMCKRHIWVLFQFYVGLSLT